MRPVLFHLGSLPVYAYSVFIVVGYILCLIYGTWQAKKQNQDPLNAIDASVWVFVGGFVGARLLYVMLSWRVFLADPLEIFRIWNGGFIYYGGFFGGIAGAFMFMRLRRLDMGIWADLLAPAGMICLIAGRVGCFLNGCCYGKFAPDLACGVVYPMAHPGLGLAQLPVHPAPLYESAACLLISLGLIWRMPHKRFGGEIFWLMWLLYSIARFVIEFFRADPRGYIPALHLSTSQAFSVVTFAAAVIFLARGWLAPAARLNGAPGSEAPAP